MVKPYSIDLRERVVKRAAAGESIRAVAAAFEISPSAVSKWSGRQRATGSVAPAQMGGYKPVILAAHRDFVRARFAEVPELTLRGLKKDLAERGVEVSYGAVWRFVHAEGLSFKKNRSRQRAGSAGRRPAARAMEKISGEN
jgi:putative transposase